MGNEIEAASPEEKGLCSAQGEIYLPETRKIAPDSPEFIEVVSGSLPREVSAVVTEHYAAARHGYRRIEILAILVALLGVVWFIYLYYPKAMSALPFKFEWRYSGPRFPTDSPYIEDYRQARIHFDADHYATAIRVVKGPLSRMEERILPRQDELFYIYFASCEGAEERKEWAGAVSWARRLVGEQPDNLQWRYFLVLSQRRGLGSCEDFLAGLQKGEMKDNWEWKLLEVDQALKALQALEGKIGHLRKPLPDQERVITQLTLLKAELLTLKWMLEGGKGTARFPDDLGQPGVDAREKAWQFCAGRKLEPFLKLQIFILKVLLEQDSIMNHIYWNGKECKTKKDLQDCRKELDESLKGMQDKGGNSK
ncbi:MAG: hypothetical protein HPZ91_04275 [Lentisphaeria bacterium]|nr:hypothetical protein [Lentisphaeria bacterium]